MSLSLRDYQSTCVDSIFDHWTRVRSTGIVVATALGKTIIFSHVIARRHAQTGKRAMVIAHRKELIDQALDKITRAVGLPCDIEMGDRYANDDLFKRRPVVISTVQSLNSGNGTKRFQRFDPTDFDCIVYDECHHAAADTYQNTINHFKQNPDCRFLNVTATPDRGDGKDLLGPVCDSYAFKYDILDGQANGWLTPITQLFCNVTSLDLSHVRTTSEGELNEEDLKKIMEAEENVQGVCHPSLEVLYGLAPETLNSMPVPEWKNYLLSLNRTPRRSIIFTVSVAQAEACSNILNRVVPNISEWVCGETPRKTREQILARFSSGETAVCVNCGVLTEGYDNPFVECVFMARPTKIRSLYAQMAGRCNRVLPGIVDGLSTKEERLAAIKSSAKPHARIHDFVGNSGSHTLICAIHMMAGNSPPEVVEKAVEQAKKLGKPVNVTRSLESAGLIVAEEKKERMERMRLAEEARKKQIVAKAKFRSVEVNPFGQSASAPLVKQFHGNRSKDGRVLSDKQLYWLREAGVPPHSITYNQANGIISKQRVRLGTKQAIWLRKHGYNPDHFSRQLASQLIDTWKNNNWQRPDNEADIIG